MWVFSLQLFSIRNDMQSYWAVQLEIISKLLLYIVMFTFVDFLWNCVGWLELKNSNIFSSIIFSYCLWFITLILHWIFGFNFSTCFGKCLIIISYTSIYIDMNFTASFSIFHIQKGYRMCFEVYWPYYLVGIHCNCPYQYGAMFLYGRWQGLGNFSELLDFWQDHAKYR